MKDLIETFVDKKAQIAGAIMAEIEQSKRIGDDFTVSKINILELQAELYDAMIELAKEFEKFKQNG